MKKRRANLKTVELCLSSKIVSQHATTSLEDFRDWCHLQKLKRCGIRDSHLTHLFHSAKGLWGGLKEQL